MIYLRMMLMQIVMRTKVVEINYNGTGDWDYQYRIIYQGDVKEVELGRKDRGENTISLSIWTYQNSRS